MISYKNIFTYDKNGSVQRLLTPNTHKQKLKQIYFILKHIKRQLPIGIYPVFYRPAKQSEPVIYACPCEPACAICGKHTAIVEEVTTMPVESLCGQMPKPNHKQQFRTIIHTSRNVKRPATPKNHWSDYAHNINIQLSCFTFLYKYDYSHSYNCHHNIYCDWCHITSLW